MPQQRKNGIEPVKFTAFFDEFEKVVTEPHKVQTNDGVRNVPNNNAIIFTDAELIDETNDRLEPNQRITHRTFQHWKKQFKDGELSPEIENRFFRVYQTAIRKSKEKLFNALVIDSAGWQRFAWIMERKFNESWGKPDDKKNDQKQIAQPIKIVKTYNNQINESNENNDV